MKIKYLLNGITDSFFSKKLLNKDILEKKATCDNCLQSPKKYKANLKCCTFWPFIPNYVVGAILSSKKTRYQEAQKTIRKLIQNQGFVLPLGIPAPPWYQKEFKANKKEIFGQNEKFLCPYYDKSKNHCGAWEYRGSVCTSFYCESSYGKKGQEFWYSLENYLSYLEMGLAEEVLVYNDYSPREMNEQLAYLDIDFKTQKMSLAKKMSSVKLKKIWKHNCNNKEDFYVKSYHFVSSLTVKHRSEILGSLGLELLHKLQNQSEKI